MSSTSGIGRGMIIAAWLLGLVLATVFFSGVLDHQRNPNQNVASAVDGNGLPTVVLQRNRQGHYIATARINGEPVEVMLDTGATRVSIPVTLARRLGLKQGRAVPTSTANGMVITYDTRLDAVSLGDITLHDVRASINPHSDQVLLGMSFLKRLEFTQRGDSLILRAYHQ